MKANAAITVNRPREDVERLWRSRSTGRRTSTSRRRGEFKAAPGDRGTEIHVDLEREPPGGKLGEAAASSPAPRRWRRSRTICGTSSSASRRARSPRSDGSPEGERAERKLKQRPAQPLDDAELEKVGVR